MPQRLKLKEKAFEWFGLTPDERFKKELPFNQNDLAVSLGIKNVDTIKRWKKEYDRYAASKAVEVKNDIAELESDPEEWWRKRQLQLNEAILESAKRGNAQSQKLAKQLAGELIEKSESKVQFELSAGEEIKIAREAERRTREVYTEPDGDTSLSQEPPLLS